MIEALIFDLDDTLFPEYQFVISGFRQVGEWIAKTRAVSGFFEIAKQLFDAGNRGKIFDAALDQLGLAHDKEIIDQMVSVYRGHKPDLTLYEDAVWALNYFKETKKLGLITDGYFLTQKNKVEALGIEGVFDSIIYSDELGRGHWKPSEVPYRKMMEFLGCKGDSCVYVADNPVKDFVGPRLLGWKTIQVYRENGQYGKNSVSAQYLPDTIVHSLIELGDIVK